MTERTPEALDLSTVSEAIRPLRALLANVGWSRSYLDDTLAAAATEARVDREGVHILVRLVGYPAVSVSVPTTRDPSLNIDSLLRWAGNAAYNRHANLGLVLKGQGEWKLFLSNWVSRSQDSEGKDAAPALPYAIRSVSDHGPSSADRSLSPESLAAAGWNSTWIASAHAAGFQKRPPVDRVLLAQCLAFRAEVLRADTAAPLSAFERSQLDADLATLMTRLLFVRHLEDRGIGKWTRGRLLESMNAAVDPVTGVNQLFASLQSQFNSELFPAGNAAAYRMPALSGSTLRRFVSSLYAVETAGISYDFGLLESDSLGLLYQQFAGVRWPRDMRESQIQLLGKSSIRARSVREHLGVFYTPTSVVDTVLELTLGAWIGTDSKNAIPSLLDLSAGSGIFLSRAFEYAARRSTFGTRNEALAWVARLHGADIDARAVAIARLNIWMAFARRFGSGRLPSLARTIRVADSLADDADDTADSIPPLPQTWKRDGFDIIVGNPPFLSNRDAVAYFGPRRVKKWRERHRSGTKEANIASLFVERALRMLRPGGYLGMVLPRNLLKTESGESLRRLIRHSCEVVYIVDCLDMKLFADADEHSAILILRRPHGSSVPNSGGEALILGDGNAQTFAPLAILLHAPVATGRLLQHSISVTAENRALAGNDLAAGYEPAWTLENPQGRCTLERLHAATGPQLVELAKSCYALDEGLRGAFVLTNPKPHGDLVDAWSPAIGANVQVERSAIRRAIRPTDTFPFHRQSTPRSRTSLGSAIVIYPYDETGAVLPWSTLKRDFPRTAQYLKGLESGLVARKGHGASEGWWVPRAVRKSAPWHANRAKSPYVLMARHGAWPRAMMIPAQTVAVGGGIAWTVARGALVRPEVLLALVSSRLWWWYTVVSGSIGDGKHYRVRPGIWERLTVPLSLTRSAKHANQIARIVRQMGSRATPDAIAHAWDQCDAIAEDAYGLTSSERDHLSSVLDVYTSMPRREWLSRAAPIKVAGPLSLFPEEAEDA